jgi:restriction system protein
VARRKNTSTVDLWLGRVATLPWWAWLGIAIAAYALGQRLAAWGITSTVRPGHEGERRAALAWQALAGLGPYLLAAACLAGAAASALRRRATRGRPAAVKSSDAGDTIGATTKREFEALVTHAFRAQGYHVTETGGGGVDMVLRKERQTYLVDCRQWRSAKVGIDVLEALTKVVTARGAAGAFVVTTGRFSREATAFAKLQNVRLIDGAVLKTLIQRPPAGCDDATTPPAKG